MRAAGSCSHWPYHAATLSPNIHATQNAAIQHTREITPATKPRIIPNRTDSARTARMTMSAVFTRRSARNSVLGHDDPADLHLLRDLHFQFLGARALIDRTGAHPIELALAGRNAVHVAVKAQLAQAIAHLVGVALAAESAELHRPAAGLAGGNRARGRIAGLVAGACHQRHRDSRLQALQGQALGFR